MVLCRRFAVRFLFCYCVLFGFGFECGVLIQYIINRRVFLMGENIEKTKYLIFRGKPLIREKNAICYGSMSDKYILFMLILSTKKPESIENSDREIPDAVLVQILDTDTSKPPHERVVKQFNKNGLYDAMDVGLIWLDKLNSEGK